MIIYKVEMCLQIALPRLKSFNLKEYAAERPIIFVEAKNPDDACYKAMNGLMSHILSQDDSLESKLLCRSLIHDIRVMRIQVPK